MRANIVLLLSIFLFIACVDRERQLKDDILDLCSRPIKLSLEEMACYVNGEDTCIKNQDFDCYKEIIYLDSTTCSSCAWNSMYKWNGILDSLRALRKNVKCYFIFHPSVANRKALYIAMKKRMFLDCPIYVDTVGSFIKNNSHIPSDKTLHTFLLDRNNNIILVGDPLQNGKIENLFWKVVNNIQ